MQLVLGTAQITQRYGVLGRQVASKHEGLALLRDAEQQGIRALDTAPPYGEAESLIGEAGWSGAVHTKIEKMQAPITSLRGSLERLRRSRVDILYLHESSAVLKGLSAFGDFSELEEAGADVLGVSIYETEEFDAACSREHIDVIQAPINPLDRRFAQERLVSARLAGMDVYARSVFLQGLLLSDTSTLPPAVRHLAVHIERFHTVASQYGVSRTALALAWIQALPLAGVVVGVNGSGELRALLEAWNSVVATEALEDLDNLPTPPWKDVDPRRWI